MRKYSLVLVVILFAAGTAGAQGHGHGTADSAKGGHSMEHMSGWKELDAYHMAMMAVWHPAKEKKDLAPVRAQAGKLATAGDAWAKAVVPAACDTPDSRAGVARVAADSRALAALVANGNDEQVMSALKDLHERFEAVNRSCKAHH